MKAHRTYSDWNLFNKLTYIILKKNIFRFIYLSISKGKHADKHYD